MRAKRISETVCAKPSTGAEGMKCHWMPQLPIPAKTVMDTQSEIDRNKQAWITIFSPVPGVCILLCCPDKQGKNSLPEFLPIMGKRILDPGRYL